jgi:ribosomal protein L11 methylase PrmA
MKPRSQSRVILSGVLETQLEMVQAALHECGIDDFEIMQDGEWVALVI